MKEAIVLRTQSDSQDDEWTITVRRYPMQIRPAGTRPNPADLPADIRLGLMTWLEGSI